MSCKPTDLPYYLELKYPIQEVIRLHQAQCVLWHIPYQVLWVESSPCLVCTWEHFERHLSGSAPVALEKQIQLYMKEQRDSARLVFPHSRERVTLSFSDCRWQCTFINLPDLRTGRALAEQTGVFLTQLLARFVEEKTAARNTVKKRT